MSQLLHCCGPFGCRPSRPRRPAKKYPWKYGPKNRVYGRAVVFELPEHITKPGDPMVLLKALGEKPCRDRAAAEKRLADLIEQNSRKIALPPAALVARDAMKEDGRSTDLLNVLTVLAKSSGNLYLRNKAPNIRGIGRVRQVVVVIPPNWSADEQQDKGAA